MKAMENCSFQKVHPCIYLENNQWTSNTNALFKARDLETNEKDGT